MPFALRPHVNQQLVHEKWRFEDYVPFGMATIEGLCWFDGVYTYIYGCPRRLYQKFGQFRGGRCHHFQKMLEQTTGHVCAANLWKLLRRYRVFPMIYPSTCQSSYLRLFQDSTMLVGRRGGCPIGIAFCITQPTKQKSQPPAFQHGPSWWSIAPVLPWVFRVYPAYFLLFQFKHLNHFMGQMHLLTSNLHIVADLNTEYHHHCRDIQGYQ